MTPEWIAGKLEVAVQFLIRICAQCRRGRYERRRSLRPTKGCTGSLLGVSESASAEFSFCTPSAPPPAYAFKLTSGYPNPLCIRLTIALQEAKRQC
jgi:hypothetical protein